MRSALIVIGTALVAVAAFALYWSLQPKTRAQITTTAPVIPTGQISGTTDGGIGAGHRPWVNTYDAGVLKSQFTAAEYRPQPDRSVQVDRPVTVFYVGGGKIVVVTGDTGVLDPPPGGVAHKGAGGSPLPSTMSSARSGRLHGVVIKEYPNTTTLTPIMTITTDNVRYDSDTLQLFTDRYTDAAGNVIAADQVPVTERGDDYDFDGKGLTIQWNGKTHRVQLLKISHGEKLVVKNTAHVGLPGNDGTKQTGQASARWPSPASVLASTNWGDVVYALATPAVPPAAESTPICHRAVFNDHVLVYQGGHKSADADKMLVDFLEGNSSPDSKPAAKSKSADRTPFDPDNAYAAPAAAQAAAALPVNPAALPSNPAALPSNPADHPTITVPTVAPAAPAPVATTQSTKGPVTITWTGELTVSELGDKPTMMPIGPGQSVVRLIGAPAVLTPVGSTVIAAQATYRTGDGALLAEPSAAIPEVVVVQDKGVTLHTKRVAFDPATSVATLSGASRLDVPQKKGPPMVVTWDDRGLLHTYGNGSDPEGVDGLDLAGHVSVDHPRFTMSSRTLRLDLEPAAKRANLDGRKPDNKNQDAPQSQPRRMVATGNVRARFHGDGGKTQGIDGDKLDVGLEHDAAGKSFPDSVVADGHVVAADTDQTLTAKHLEAVLAEKAPVPAPAVATTNPADDDPAAAVDLVSMLSTGDVHAVTKAGATADSQNLRLTTVDGIRRLELWGGGGAVVNDGKGKTLTGSVLHVSPDRNTASVDGPGTIHSVPNSDKPANTQASATTRPADVSWTDSMSLDSDKNAVEVVGNVEVKIQNADGGVSVFTGDRAHLDLEDEPKKPADKPAAKAVVAKADAKPSATGNKQVKRLVMTGHVVGETLLTLNGQTARYGHIDGDTLIYTTADGRAEIPGPGHLLVVNHKVTDVAGEKSGNRGSMAVAWQQSMVYDDAKNQIDIRGGVRAGFKPDAGTAKAAPDATPMRLEAERLLVTLKKTTPATVTTRPAGEDQGKVQIDKATAIGAVHFLAHGGDVWCHTADFDPDNQRMTAHGSDEEPGHASQLPGKSGGMFDGTFNELVFDTANEEVVSVKGVGGVMRK